MKYEEFEARAKSAFDDCSEMKRMLWTMQTVVGAVPGMVRKNERLEKEKAELKAESAALKVELDDWKGNAEGFEPDAYMRLPVDADGVPIRIGDEMNIDGDSMTVLGYRLHDDMLFLVVEDKKMGLFFAPEPSRVRHFKPEPADIWEKLEEDAKKDPCTYFGKIKDLSTGCSECPHGKQQSGFSCGQNMSLDLVERAKRLAGIEEQEGGERTAIADNEEER